jgi:intergrase/recombinase
MSDYDEYEANCKKIRVNNKILLDEFETWLKSADISNKTVSNHVSNIDFYINEYLLYEDTIEAKDGIQEVSMFFGDWFIRKAVWASQASIKSNAASLKKFYTFLLEKGIIEKEDLLELAETIKDEMPEWLATVKQYNDQLDIEDF